MRLLSVEPHFYSAEQDVSEMALITSGGFLLIHEEKWLDNVDDGVAES